MRWLLKLILLLCIIPDEATGNPLFEEGGRLYKSGRYQEAEEAYRKLLEKGLETPAVLYNLANSCYKQGKLGESILYYEKSLKLQPEDEDALHNLEMARSRTADRIPEIPQPFFVRWFNAWLALMSVKAWLLMAAALMWIALILAALRIFSTSGSGLVPAAAGLCVLSLIFLFSGFRLNARQQCREEGVLLAPNAYVKSAPDQSGTDLFMVHEGIRFSIQDRVSDWSKIRLSDGKTGWIRNGMFGVI